MGRRIKRKHKDVLKKQIDLDKRAEESGQMLSKVNEAFNKLEEAKRGLQVELAKKSKSKESILMFQEKRVKDKLETSLKKIEKKEKDIADKKKELEKRDGLMTLAKRSLANALNKLEEAQRDLEEEHIDEAMSSKDPKKRDEIMKEIKTKTKDIKKRKADIDKRTTLKEGELRAVNIALIKLEQARRQLKTGLAKPT